MIKYLLNISLISLLFVSCSTPSGKSDLEPPVPLMMVQKTEQSDTTFHEYGIDAVPEEDNILVVWHPYSGLNKIKKFKIYRSADPDGERDFDFFDDIVINNQSDQDTTYEDSQVNLETYYHYFVTVVDEDNQESFPSDTVKYFLVEKAGVTDLGTQYNPGDNVEFAFDIPSEASANGFIIRIERQIGLNSKELVHIEYIDNFFLTGNRIWSINTNVFKTLSQNIEYKWRVDLIAGNVLYKGSESNWASFKINWDN